MLFTHKINGLHENDFILASKCDIVFISQTDKKKSRDSSIRTL